MSSRSTTQFLSNSLRNTSSPLKVLNLIRSMCTLLRFYLLFCLNTEFQLLSWLYKILLWIHVESKYLPHSKNRNHIIQNGTCNKERLLISLYAYNQQGINVYSTRAYPTNNKPYHLLFRSVERNLTVLALTSHLYVPAKSLITSILPCLAPQCRTVWKHKRRLIIIIIVVILMWP